MLLLLLLLKCIDFIGIHDPVLYLWMMRGMSRTSLVEPIKLKNWKNKIYHTQSV
jgi:hypothetical protein